MTDAAVGIVLAGGRSERLAPAGLGAGGKAAVVVGDDTCLGRVCAAVAEVMARVLVVAAPGQPLPRLPDGVAIVRDAMPQGGPLAGLRDGLAHAAGLDPAPKRAFVAACDLPLLKPAVVRRLLAIAEASAARFVVPAIDGHPQVLSAVIACDLAPAIGPLVVTGRGPRALLDELVAREPESVRFVVPEEFAAVDPWLDSFCDIDTPEDLTRLKSREIPPSRG